MSGFFINIKSSGDTKYTVKLLPTMSVLELKQAIERQSSVPADRQRLIYSGKVLKDTEPVASYNIKEDHTIHLVKSAAKAGSTTTPTAPAPGAAATPTETGVPANIAAGQGAFNPLADLTGARYAGYSQLPSASTFGPDGGMNNAFTDPEQIAQMMSDPQYAQWLSAMLDNPQMLDYMINQNPQLRAMGPQVREMLSSPYFRQMLSNPEMMRSMMEMQRASGGFPGAAGGSFPAPGANPTLEGGAGSASSEAAPAANPFATFGGAGGAGGAGGLPPIDPFALFGAGAGGAAPAAAPVDNRAPEDRYESQLRQLNDMGFFEFDRNIEALRRTGGSVQGAIEYLLSGN